MAGYSGLWDGVHGENYSLQANRAPLKRQLARMMRKGTRSLTRLNEVLDTVVASQSINGGAAVTYPRVEGVAAPGDFVSGGANVGIETVTQIAASSSTTAADAADVDEMVNYTTQPTYPVDASGNGGGGKLSDVL